MLSISKGTEKNDFDRNHGNTELIMSDMKSTAVHVRDKL